MPTQGPMTWFNEYVEHVDADDLNSGSFTAILTAASQALNPDFVGGSGNCTYADLTAELATANGYTNGGLAITGNAIVRSTNVVLWGFDPLLWTLTGTINFRYLVLKNSGNFLVSFADIYSDGGAGVNLSATTGPLGFTFSAGALTLTRV